MLKQPREWVWNNCCRIHRDRQKIQAPACRNERVSISLNNLDGFSYSLAWLPPDTASPGFCSKLTEFHKASDARKGCFLGGKLSNIHMIMSSASTLVITIVIPVRWNLTWRGFNVWRWAFPPIAVTCQHSGLGRHEIGAWERSQQCDLHVATELRMCLRLPTPVRHASDTHAGHLFIWPSIHIYIETWRGRDLEHVSYNTQ